MATYVNDLRLKEIATGDESGTWGTSTNTNLELIAEAMGHGAEAVANASTHTITMADGATDQFRSTFLRLTGGGQACTVTLAPNTLSHTWIMRNETAAALTLTQGSGANVAIAAGQTKIVATDGAGSGAVVYEMDDLELAGNLAVGGTLAVTGAFTGANATFTTADNTDTLSLISTDADASSGPNLNMFRNSASPADSDELGNIAFNGRNDNSQTVKYAEIEAYALDVSDGTEDAVLNFNVMQAGTAVSFFKGNNTEVVVNDDSRDLDFRVESDNSTHALFVQGSDGAVGIGVSAPSSVLEVSGALTVTRSDVANDRSTISNEGGLFVISAASGGAGGTYPMLFKTASTERMRIDASGNALVGRTASLTGQSSSISANTVMSVHGVLAQHQTNVGILQYASNVFSLRAYGASANTGVIAFNTGGGGGSADTERMRIDSAGKILIGDSGSHTSDLLQIETPASGGGHGIQIRRNDSNADQGVGSITFGNNTATDLASISAKTDGATDNGALLFNTSVSGGANTERMRIDSSGNLLVGTTSPLSNSRANFVRASTTSSALVINAHNTAATNTSRATSPIFRGATQGNGADVHLVLTDSVANNYYFGGNQAGTWVATNTNGVRLSNGGTSWASDSDERLKDIIEPIENGLEKVLTLRSVIGKYKTDEEDKRRVFLIAQDVQAVLPEAVFENEGTLMLQYTDLIPLCIKAIQEQQATITDLTTRLTALENN